MRPLEQAAVGVMVAGAGWLYFVFFFLPSLGPAPFLLLGLLVGLGQVAAGAGLLRVGKRGGLGLVAAGFLVAGAAAIGFLLQGLGDSDLFGHLLTAVGLAQAAWVGVLWAAEDGAQPERRLGALQLSFLATALAGAWYVVSTLGGTGLALVPGPGLFLIGSIVAVRGFRALRGAARPAVPAAEA